MQNSLTKNWANWPIAVIDFEGNQSTGIVEYGIVVLEEGEIAGTWTRVCRSRAVIAARDVAVHGIETEDTLGCEAFDIEWELFKQLRKQGPLGAHHAPYEDLLLRDVWAYLSKVPDFLNPQKYSSDWGPWVDSCELYKILFPRQKSYKLSNLIAAFGLQQDLEAWALKYCPQKRKHYHCALYDALASALLLKNLLNYDSIKNNSIEWLLLNSMISNKKRQAHQQLTLF